MLTMLIVPVTLGSSAALMVVVQCAQPVYCQAHCALLLNLKLVIVPVVYWVHIYHSVKRMETFHRYSVMKDIAGVLM